jgi:hypothetical protein
MIRSAAGVIASSGRGIVILDACDIRQVTDVSVR